MNKQLMAEWLEERDRTIESMDVERMKAFCLKWQKRGVYKNEPLPADNVIEIALRKMALASMGVSKDTKRKARQWLKERGYREEIW